MMKKKICISAIGIFLFLCTVSPSLMAQTLSTPEMYRLIERRQKLLSTQLIQVPKFPEPGIIAKIVLSEAVVNLAKEAYYAGLDYRQTSIDSLKYAKDFLDKGNIDLANKYVNDSERLSKLSHSQMDASFRLLDGAIDMAVYYTVAKAAGIAISTITGPYGHALVTAAELRTGYQVDKALEGTDKAKAELFKKVLVEAVVKFSGVGEVAQKAWGGSRVYPVLEKLMGSSEFKKEMLESFMRLGGKAAGYTAEESTKFITESLLSLKVGEPPQVKEAKQSFSPIAKPIPRNQVVSNIVPIAMNEPVKIIKMPEKLPMNLPQGNISDSSKLREGNPQENVTPVKVEFTQTFDGLFTQSADSPGSRNGSHSGTLTDGTRVNVKGDSRPGDFTGSFSGQTVAESGYTPATHNNSAFSGSSVGKISAIGFKEGDLKGTMTVTVPAGTQTATVSGDIKIKTDGSLSMPSYSGPITVNATGAKVGAMTGEWNQSKTTP